MLHRKMVSTMNQDLLNELRALLKKVGEALQTEEQRVHAGIKTAFDDLQPLRDAKDVLLNLLNGDPFDTFWLSKLQDSAKLLRCGDYVTLADELERISRDLSPSAPPAIPTGALLTP